jgi:hypothetical protein
MTIYGFHKLTSTLKSMENVGSDDRYFEGLLTVQMKDKQGEVTIVDELYKVLPVWIDRGAPISDTHSNRIVGKGINYSRTTVKNGEGHELPAIKITGKIFKNYELDNVIWNKIKNNEYKGLSFGGATRSARSPIKMKDGSTAYALSDLEHYEVAVCADPAVPMAIITDFNQIAKANFNSSVRDDGKMVIQCDNMGCYVNKDSLIKIEDEDDKNTEVKVLDEWKNDDNDSGEESKKKSDRSDKWDKREKELKNIESRLNDEGFFDDDVKPKGKWDRHEGYGGDKDFNSYKAGGGDLLTVMEGDKPENYKAVEEGRQRGRAIDKTEPTGLTEEQLKKWRAIQEDDKEDSDNQYYNKFMEKKEMLDATLGNKEEKRPTQPKSDMRETETSGYTPDLEKAIEIVNKAGYRVDTEDRNNGTEINDTKREIPEKKLPIKGSLSQELPTQIQQADLNESQTFEQKVQALMAEGKSRESAEKIVGSFVHKVEASSGSGGAGIGGANMTNGGTLTTQTGGANNPIHNNKCQCDKCRSKGLEKAKGDYCPNCGKHKKLGVADNGRDMGDMTSMGGACPNCGHGFKDPRKPKAADISNTGSGGTTEGAFNQDAPNAQRLNNKSDDVDLDKIIEEETENIKGKKGGGGHRSLATRLTSRQNAKNKADDEEDEEVPAPQEEERPEWLMNRHKAKATREVNKVHALLKLNKVKRQCRNCGLTATGLTNEGDPERKQTPQQKLDNDTKRNTKYDNSWKYGEPELKLNKALSELKKIKRNPTAPKHTQNSMANDVNNYNNWSRLQAGVRGHRDVDSQEYARRLQINAVRAGRGMTEKYPMPPRTGLKQTKRTVGASRASLGGGSGKGSGALGKSSGKDGKKPRSLNPSRNDAKKPHDKDDDHESPPTPKIRYSRGGGDNTPRQLKMSLDELKKKLPKKFNEHDRKTRWQSPDEIPDDEFDHTDIHGLAERGHSRLGNTNEVFGDSIVQDTSSPDDIQSALGRRIRERGHGDRSGIQATMSRRNANIMRSNIEKALDELKKLSTFKAPPEKHRKRVTVEDIMAKGVKEREEAEKRVRAQKIGALEKSLTELKKLQISGGLGSRGLGSDHGHTQGSGDSTQVTLVQPRPEDDRVSSKRTTKEPKE